MYPYPAPTPLQVRGAERSVWGTHIAHIGSKDDAPGGAALLRKTGLHEEGRGLLPFLLDRGVSICRWGSDGVTLRGGPSGDLAAVEKTSTPEQVRQ
ncbi:hypothetical protein NDU88_001074 [Pleurodeles waltl]|uniref:Uncharacterized protein n=1 Tax=Pleurodeles waltl TaxID=8319 RepID=A0AAV7WLE9_PLEWA|nr:hypothetical protein NDU88_001074 [Pleurodeles waltl]